MRNFSPHGFFAWIAALISLLGGPSANAQVATLFVENFSTLQTSGSYWYQGFTISRPTTFVLRMTSDYVADAAVVSPSQLGNFINNQSFSAYVLFDNQYGTKSVTLQAGSYYAAIRNQANGQNTYSLELDYSLQVPADAGNSYSFLDHYIQGNEILNANGGKLWHGFTIQTGIRYFIDGCNTGLGTYIIPASELAAFKSGGSFNYYTTYSGTANSYPGFVEIKLPPGSYYLAFVNSNSIKKPVTYTMERWRRNTVVTNSLDMSSPASWATSKGKVNIKVAKVANLSSSGKSGSLRLRLWANKSKFTGGSLTGYVIGTRTLSPLTAGYRYTNINGKVPYKKPPSGRYYSTITLEEFTKAGWVIRDYISFSGTAKF